MSTARDPLAVSDVHLGIPAPDAAATAAAYRSLLGEPDGAGRWTAANATVALLAADAAPTADLQVGDLDGAQKLLRRRGLNLAERSGGFAVVDHPPVGVTGAPAGGVRTPQAATGIAGVDHILFMHADTESAIALYGGRLGLDLRLVKPLGDGATQLFFRTSSLIVEVVAGDAVAGRDPFGGVVWRCDDVDAEHDRLADLGLEMSDVRVGRKPGTRVCTVRERALGTPTLLIEQSPPGPA